MGGKGSGRRVKFNWEDIEDGMTVRQAVVAIGYKDEVTGEMVYPSRWAVYQYAGRHFVDLDIKHKRPSEKRPVEKKEESQ